MGYLLDALPDDEIRLVEDNLASNSHLRVRLQYLRELLFPLAADNTIFEPPDGLSDRVLGALESHVSLEAVWNDAPSAVTSSVSVHERAKDQVRPGRAWADLFVGLTAAIVGLCILSPAILRSREGARASQCAGRLQELGQMIRDYAFFRPEHVVPEVESDGPLAFAGIYAIRLGDANLLDDRSKLWCPDNTPANQLSFAFVGSRGPTIQELVEMPTSRRNIWQRVAGGSYSYNLGIMINSQHATPRMQSRPNFAILADAPLRTSGEQKAWTVHLGTASNILYEDGHTQLVRFDKPLDLVDHPYWNHNGKNRAGIDVNDSVLGGSGRNPLDSNAEPQDTSK